MKVLIINVVCGIKSTGRICTDLACALSEHGVDVKVAYGRGKVPKEFKKYAVKIGTKLDICIHYLRSRFFDASGFGSKLATIKFISWVKKYNPDVIHLHNIHGYYINIEVLFRFLKNYKGRIIWTLHDCWSFTGHSAYCDAAKCERWQTGCFSCPYKNVYPKSFFDNSKRNWERKKSLFTDVNNITIVTPSCWLRELVGRSFLNKFKTIVINNGINTDIFYPRITALRVKYKIEDKFIILGVASSWNYLKGFDDFIKLSRYIDDNYIIVLVGLNKNQKRILPHNIIGIEKTENLSELAELYSIADVFVNLTYCDTYPTVNLEALSCGTPVITYNTGGSVEPIINGVNGYIVKQGDIKGIKELIYELQMNKKNEEVKIDERNLYEFKNQINIYKNLILGQKDLN